MNNTTNSLPIDPDELLSEVEFAKLYKVTRRAVQQWRFTGNGPRYVRISARCVRYRRRDINEWAEERLRTSTSDPGKEAMVSG